jgi:nucleotide-binding universal stress UspA family protein
MYDKILIAYDASKEAQRALAEGCRLAKVVEAEITVVTVLEPAPGYYNLAAITAPEVPGLFRETRLNELNELQRKAVQFASDQDLVVHTVLLEESEVAGILEAARTIKANLIVMGLRRHLQNLEWAGTVRQVANDSPCSILAVV